MNEKRIEELAEEFFRAGVNYTSLGCCEGDYCASAEYDHDERIKNWLKETLESYGQERERAGREKAIKEFRSVVNNESYEWDGGKEDWEDYERNRTPQD